MNEQARTLNGLTILAGTWLIIAPFVLNYSSSGNSWLEIILGATVIIFGLIRLATPQIAWPSWINSLVGLWVIVVPWIIPGTSSAARWNEFLTGGVVAILGYASAAATENRQRVAHH
jgi:hypothetical protein